MLHTNYHTAHLSVEDTADLLEISRRDVRRLMSTDQLRYDLVEGQYECRYEDVISYVVSKRDASQRR